MILVRLKRLHVILKITFDQECIKTHLLMLVSEWEQIPVYQYHMENYFKGCFSRKSRSIRCNLI